MFAVYSINYFLTSIIIFHHSIMVYYDKYLST